MFLRIEGANLFPRCFSLILCLFIFSFFSLQAGADMICPVSRDGTAEAIKTSDTTPQASNSQSKPNVCTTAEDLTDKAALCNESKSKPPASHKQKKPRKGQKKHKPAANVSTAKGPVRLRPNSTTPPPDSTVEPNGPSLSILVVGDSLAVGIGMYLSNAFEGVRKVRVKPMGKVSTGLDSPGFYDWPRVLEHVLEAERFDFVVIMIGANDAHNSSGSLTWGLSYESEFEDLLKIPARKHMTTLVVGLPPMRESRFSQRVMVANEAMRKAVRLFPEVCVYIDSFNRFADAKGNFADIVDLNGESKKVRAGDGVHFTAKGYQLLSNMVMNAALESRH